MVDGQRKCERGNVKDNLVLEIRSHFKSKLSKSLSFIATDTYTCFCFFVLLLCISEMCGIHLLFFQCPTLLLTVAACVAPLVIPHSNLPSCTLPATLPPPASPSRLPLSFHLFRQLLASPSIVITTSFKSPCRLLHCHPCPSPHLPLPTLPLPCLASRTLLNHSCLH